MNINENLMVQSAYADVTRLYSITWYQCSQYISFFEDYSKWFAGKLPNIQKLL